jgi:TonB family protein
MLSMEKIFVKIENGELFKTLQFFLFTLIVLIWTISGIEFTGNEIIEAKNDNVKRYIVKKVSSLPENKSQDETAELKKEDDTLSLEEIKERYISYVVSKIERNKIYPLKEQKLNHEGIVRFIIEITKKGDVTKFLFVQRCRYPALNNAAVEAVKKSLPFVKFPPQLERDTMKIKIKMEYFLK